MTKLIIPHIFRETVKKTGSKDALGRKNKNTNQYEYITYSQLETKVNYFASALVELGVNVEDKVALMSENCPEWVITDLGAMSCSALNVPVYPTLTYPQLEYILNDCGAKAIVVSSDTHYQKVVKNFDLVPNLEFVVCMEEVKKVEHSKIKTYSFDEVLEMGKNSFDKNTSIIDQRIDSIKQEDTCSIIYTSGTTGNPKGVMLTHGNFMSNAVESAKLLLHGDDNLELSFLPLSHVLERVVYYAIVVVQGHRVAYAESVELITKNLLEVKPTILVSVPRIYEKIYSKVMEGILSASPLRQKIFNWAMKVGKEYYESKQYGNSMNFLLEIEHKLAHKLVFSKIHDKTGGNIQIFVSGGAPLMKELAEFFAYIGLPILEGYGLTETSPVICFNRKGQIKFGTVGQTIPDVEVKIAEDGEILTRGPNVMKGYYNNPTATAEVLDSDGWFKTGDIGELDSENYLKITDRKKEIIVMSNGKNVAPQPIENLMKTSKYIEQIALIGDNKKYISALVVPNMENLKLKAKELGINSDSKEEVCKDKKINEFMRSEIDNISADKVAKFEQIKKFVLIPDEFSLEKNEITPTLKLKRKEINKSFDSDIKSMYDAELSHSN